MCLCACGSFTDRASGKYWAVGMNNECFKIGVVTLGVQCGPYATVNFEVHVVNVPAELDLSQPTDGEACIALSSPDLVHTLATAIDHPPPPTPPLPRKPGLPRRVGVPLH